MQWVQFPPGVFVVSVFRAGLSSAAVGKPASGEKDMTTKTKIDLKPFCCTDCERYDINEPFVQDGFRIGTDGRIIVRVSAMKATPTTGKRLPNCKSVFDWRAAGGEFIKLDDLN